MLLKFVYDDECCYVNYESWMDGIGYSRVRKEVKSFGNSVEWFIYIGNEWRIKVDNMEEGMRFYEYLVSEEKRGDKIIFDVFEELERFRNNK